MPKKAHVMALRDKTHVRSFSGVVVASEQNRRKAKFLETQYLSLLRKAKQLKLEINQAKARGNIPQAYAKMEKLKVIATRCGSISDELRKQGRSIQG